MSSLSTGAKVGIAVGAVAGTIGIGIAVYVISAKFKAAQQAKEENIAQKMRVF